MCYVWECLCVYVCVCLYVCLQIKKYNWPKLDLPSKKLLLYSFHTCLSFAYLQGIHFSSLHTCSCMHVCVRVVIVANLSLHLPTGGEICSLSLILTHFWHFAGHFVDFRLLRFCFFGIFSIFHILHVYFLIFDFLVFVFILCMLCVCLWRSSRCGAFFISALCFVAFLAVRGKRDFPHIWTH